MARAIRTPRDSGIQAIKVQALKPEPPATLWAELDALCARRGMTNTVRQPPGSFTAAQYARECGLHPSSASIRLRRLLHDKEIEFLGRGPNNQKFYRITKK